jgi:HAD superfamily hydrolase (TIGR01509 family)
MRATLHFIFDLDGVLVEFKELHKYAFIQAWNECMPAYPINDEYHTAHLEARSTRQKLDVLATNFGIIYDRQQVADRKQAITATLLESAHTYQRTRLALEWAHTQGIPMACCSNSIRSTVLTSLAKIVPLSYFSLILSNEDVQHPKPHPEIYEHAVQLLGIPKESAIVFEDSAVGKEAARAAGLRVIDIVDAMDITTSFLLHSLAHRARPAIQHCNVVIPMAGLGSRFQTAGYTVPKPFLPVFGKPMFEWVISNIIPDSLRPYVSVHIIVRQEHIDRFRELNVHNYNLHTVPQLTEGAACTVLTVKDAINNDDPLVIANSDQYLDWDADNFYRCLSHPDYDGVISSFYQPNSSDLRWSYANIDSEGHVTDVQEKKFIGPIATTGIYGWKRGADFVRDAETMIERNIRVNNEFYVCPVYNQSIARGAHIRTLHCEKMWGLGVPDDYEYFLQHYRSHH